MKFIVNDNTKNLIQIFNECFPLEGNDQKPFSDLEAEFSDKEKRQDIRITKHFTGTYMPKGFWASIGHIIVGDDDKHLDVPDQNFNYLKPAAHPKRTTLEGELLFKIFKDCEEYQAIKKEHWIGGNYNKNKIQDHRYVALIFIWRVIKDVENTSSFEQKLKQVKQLKQFCANVKKAKLLVVTSTKSDSEDISLKTTLSETFKHLDVCEQQILAQQRQEALRDAFENFSFTELLDKVDSLLISLSLGAPEPLVSGLTHFVENEKFSAAENFQQFLGTDKAKPSEKVVLHKDEMSLIGSNDGNFKLLKILVKPLLVLERLRGLSNSVEITDFSLVNVNHLTDLKLGPTDKSLFGKEELNELAELINLRQELIKVLVAIEQIKKRLGSMGDLAKYFLHDEIDFLRSKSQMILGQLTIQTAKFIQAIEKHQNLHAQVWDNQRNWARCFDCIDANKLEIEEEINIQLKQCDKIQKANTDSAVVETLNNVKQSLLEINQLMGSLFGRRPEISNLRVKNVLAQMEKDVNGLSDVEIKLNEAEKLLDVILLYAEGDTLAAATFKNPSTPIPSVLLSPVSKTSTATEAPIIFPVQQKFAIKGIFAEQKQLILSNAKATVADVKKIFEGCLNAVVLLLETCNSKNISSERNIEKIKNLKGLQDELSKSTANEFSYNDLKRKSSFLPTIVPAIRKDDPESKLTAALSSLFGKGNNSSVLTVALDKK